MEDVEGALALGDVDSEALASFPSATVTITRSSRWRQSSRTSMRSLERWSSSRKQSVMVRQRCHRARPAGIRARPPIGCGCLDTPTLAGTAFEGDARAVHADTHPGQDRTSSTHHLSHAERRCNYRKRTTSRSCLLWYRYRMPISSLDRGLAELAAAVRPDGTLAALAGRASAGDAYMLGMLVSGMTV